MHIYQNVCDILGEIESDIFLHWLDFHRKIRKFCRHLHGKTVIVSDSRHGEQPSLGTKHYEICQTYDQEIQATTMDALAARLRCMFQNQKKKRPEVSAFLFHSCFANYSRLLTTNSELNATVDAWL
ncbi:hypothetical protein C8R34_11920 [Nitrosomonas sp. Nm84]|nr:hypothetical protein C8R34_11920 [Nitrosomonas sp. Nm84]